MPWAQLPKRLGMVFEDAESQCIVAWPPLLSILLRLSNQSLDVHLPSTSAVHIPLLLVDSV